MRAITDDYVLIGDGGTARALSDFVHDPDGEPPLVDGSDVLPNVEGELDPCVFYPSTNADAGVAFGLRSYALIALVDGDQRLPVRLRWNSGATDPDAPVAHLDVTVAGYLPAPPDGVTDLRDLDHQVVARLLYQVPVRGTADSATLSLDLGAMGFRPVGTYGAAEASFAIPSQDAFNRLWLAMTDPAAEARLELRCLATGYRVTWAWYDELVTDLVPPGGVVTGGSSAHNPAYPNAKGGYRVRYVYPVPLEDVQVVPFHLPPADHPHVYDQVPPEFRPAPGGGVLLKDEHDPGEGRAPVVYYTHTGLPGQYYYEPHEFRIPRRDDGSRAPEVVLAFKDVTTAGGALDYRVRMDYRLAPHTDRFALASLRRHLGRTNPRPTLTVLVPEQVSMVLRLPQHRDGTTTLVDVPRPVGSATLEDGIADSLEFTPAELKNLVALLSSAG
ncbi:hypothetical protein ACFQV2_20750 [Actinokineospora soli]|uniref:Uncharacterized protein n=1 Tax=Actinokineospora soli TaxID=1048753 RepID=A0ABW2TP37_9PSEU